MWSGPLLKDSFGSLGCREEDFLLGERVHGLARDLRITMDVVWL